MEDYEVFFHTFEILGQKDSILITISIGCLLIETGLLFFFSFFCVIAGNGSISSVVSLRSSC